MAERGKFFKETMVSEPRKGWHNLSFDNSFSCNAGKLYPTKRLEVFPGDTIHDRSSAMARLQPLVSPVMGKMNLFSYHFIVRNRDIWTQWDKFITNYDQKKTWQQNSSFVPPEMPYIDIREVYWNLFAGDNLSTLADLNHVYYVALWQHNGGSYCTISRQFPAQVLSYARGQVIAFVPNASDLISEFDWYDPFCENSLLNFLGVNIDGFKKEQGNNTLAVYNSLMNYYDIDPQTLDNVYPNQFTTTDLTEVGLYSEIGVEAQYYYIEDFAEWLHEHIVLGFACAFDKTGYSGIALHLFADNTVQQSGTPTLQVDFGLSAFVSSNYDLFDFKLSDLVLRAYRFIYDEYFRDENYIQVNPNTDFSRDGNDLDWANQSTQTIYEYLTFVRKSFEHDLYTSALPQAQRGNPVRFLPDSNVNFIDKGIITTKSRNLSLQSDGTTYAGLVASSSESSASTGRNIEMSVDLSAATIENLRFFNSMQRYLERKARTGGRYYEYMIGQWGYEISDAKLNRPIYLGGDKTPVQISEVLQTSSSNVDTGQPLGDLAGRGVAIGRDNSIEFTSPDYGFLIELCAVVPRTAYGQGISPIFKRFNYMDYPLPDFANLGEEPIKKRELYATLRKANDDSTFGYTARYYQFKYERDQIHGDMLTSLRHWNFARLFDGVPYNGKDFLEVDPSYRQFAVTDKTVDHFIVTMWHDIEIHRALPEISIPSL